MLTDIELTSSLAVVTQWTRQDRCILYLSTAIGGIPGISPVYHAVSGRDDAGDLRCFCDAILGTANDHALAGLTRSHSSLADVTGYIDANQR